MATHFPIAAVQASPVYLNLTASVDKAIGLAEEAAKQGCRLIVFPETFLPGYPFWIWLGAPAWGLQFVQRYHQNSLVAGGPEHLRLEQAARRLGIAMVVGCSERAHGTLYIAQVVIDADGRTLRIRRKLRATHAERTLFGEGNGADLAVFDTAVGRLGALNCWEHVQPLNRYALFAQHEQVHAASWPCFSLYPGRAYALGPEANLAVSQSYAIEGQCFVAAACAVTDAPMLEMLIQMPGQEAMLAPGGGHARIFAPDGRPLGDTIAPEREGLVVAEIDLDDITIAKTFGDPVGHYSRPEVTRMLLNRTEPAPLTCVDSDAQFEAMTPAEGR